MRVRLYDLPQEGKVFEFNELSPELFELQKELKVSGPSYFRVFIRPDGNTFQLEASVSLKRQRLCVKCGWDIDQVCEFVVSEVLFIQKKKGARGDHLSHGNQSVDFLSQGPEMVLLSSADFELVDHMREVILLKETGYPACEDPQCPRLREIMRVRKNLIQEGEEFYAKKNSSSEASPFVVLKDLALKKNK